MAVYLSNNSYPIFGVSFLKIQVIDNLKAVMLYNKPLFLKKILGSNSIGG